MKIVECLEYQLYIFNISEIILGAREVSKAGYDVVWAIHIALYYR